MLALLPLLVLMACSVGGAATSSAPVPADPAPAAAPAADVPPPPSAAQSCKPAVIEGVGFDSRISDLGDGYIRINSGYAVVKNHNGSDWYVHGPGQVHAWPSHVCATQEDALEMEQLLGG